MDNEPSGWDNTHRDVHPARPLGRTGQPDEQYAAAVKGVDPTAAIDGPGDFGWAAYVDDGPPGDDRQSWRFDLGGAVYLQQLRCTRRARDPLARLFRRTLLPTTRPASVHRAVRGGRCGHPGRPARVDQSLWDPTYVENDWIGQYYGDIDLIGRMQSWINQYYPEPRLLSPSTTSRPRLHERALAEADALGIFGPRPRHGRPVESAHRRQPARSLSRCTAMTTAKE